MSFECVLPGKLWTWYDEGVEVHDGHLTWFQREGANRYASGAACDQTFADFLARGSWVDGVPQGVVDAVTGWVASQARNASMEMSECGRGATHLLIDHDAKYTVSFEAQEVEVKRVGPRASTMNAFAERWVPTLRKECLDHFLVLGERPLDHLVREFVARYNPDRPHQAKGNVPLPEADEDEPRTLKFPSGEVKCRERLGGLLKHYFRAAA